MNSLAYIKQKKHYYSLYYRRWYAKGLNYYIGEEYYREDFAKYQDAKDKLKRILNFYQRCNLHD